LFKSLVVVSLTAFLVACGGGSSSPNDAPLNDSIRFAPPGEFGDSGLGYCAADGPVQRNHSGYTGSGFTNTINTNGASITYQVNVPASGNYPVNVRFANGSGTRRTAELNDADFQFPSTGEWDQWETESGSVRLNAGNNRIVLKATNGSGLPNIDFLAIEGGSPADCNSPIGGGITNSDDSSSSDASMPLMPLMPLMPSIIVAK